MAEYKSISTHINVIGLPDAQKQYTQKCFARASAIQLLALSVFFGAITAAEFNSISLVRMCERSRTM